MEIALDTVLRVMNGFVARTKGKKASPIGPDTQLLAEGHVDSFALAELIIELESVLGLKIEEGGLIPEDFESPRALRDRLEQITN